MRESLLAISLLLHKHHKGPAAAKVPGGGGKLGDKALALRAQPLGYGPLKDRPFGGVDALARDHQDCRQSPVDGAGNETPELHERLILQEAVEVKLTADADCPSPELPDPARLRSAARCIGFWFRPRLTKRRSDLQHCLEKKTAVIRRPGIHGWCGRFLFDLG